jgi:hypothetical protein
MKRHLIFLGIVLMGFAPSLWATAIKYDYVACVNAKITPLVKAPDFIGFNVESWGIVASSTTKEMENATTHCMGYGRVMGGKQAGQGVCKWTDTAGNTFVGQYDVTAPGEGTWTFLTGTGRFKGAHGGGHWKVVAQGKPIDAGTVQNCRRDWGSYTSP